MIPTVPSPPSLPIDAVLPEVLSALTQARRAVLVAEPGAGKTTRVPLALLDAPWRKDGKIILIAPRRLAARAAARRMAASLGEAVGERVGYRMRMETKTSRHTRIEVVTEGVFTRLIIADPALEGIAAVLFDEFHERALQSDLGLALALDCAGALREDLRLLVMSATLDAARVAALLGDAPVIRAKGRGYPVTTHYRPRDPLIPFAEQMAGLIRTALAQGEGSALAFLPGEAEIRAVAARLSATLDAKTRVLPLYGALSSVEQDAALRPAAEGERKVVLATSIAETSLTIEGVRIVIDSGLARVPRHESATGLTRLVTEPVSQAAAEQRRGRAGRTEPGVCWRLWGERQTAALPPFARPEILEADLAPLVLDLAAWGVVDPQGLSFLDPPPAHAWREAVLLLQELGALESTGRLTALGRALHRLPLHPRLGAMLLAAAAEGAGRLGAEIATVLSEPGLGGGSDDLATRLRTLRHGGGAREKNARALAARLATLVGAAGDGEGGPNDPHSAGRHLARAYPDRIAKARGKDGAFLLANGRGGAVDEASPLGREAFLVVADLTGAAAQARIRLAAPITREEIGDLFADKITTEDLLSFDKASGAVRARRQVRLGALVLREEMIAAPAGEATCAALLGGVREAGLAALPWSRAQRALRARSSFLAATLGAPWPDLSDAALLETLEDWLGPLIAGLTRLDAIDVSLLEAALALLLPHALRRELETLLPDVFTAPTGSRLAIDYEAENGPSITVRVQELFGLDRHPSVAAGRMPLTLILTSPAGRPIQITRDLPAFWRGSWQETARSLKGRYPKHPWPDDPLRAVPTRRAKSN